MHTRADSAGKEHPLAELDEPSPASRLAHALLSLGLSRHPGSDLRLLEIGARALKEALPETLPEREAKILANADELARAARSVPVCAHQAYGYLALVACALARNTQLSRRNRDLGLVGAVALSALGTENVCAALGVDGWLDLLVLDDSLDAGVRAIAARASRHDLPRDLAEILEAAVDRRPRALEEPTGERKRRSSGAADRP